MGNGNGGRRASGLHVAIIMDGSGRWATVRGLPRSAGHRAGQAAVCRTIDAAPGIGIRTLTLFSFSYDNWGRPAPEVAELLNIFERFFAVDAPAFSRQGVRLSVVGRRDRLPGSLLAAIEVAETTSQAGDRLHARFAIDYSGRDAILRAARRFPGAREASTVTFGRLVTQDTLSREPVPDIDLLIRTGGELRLSDCPLWEIAYAELYFTPCLWPEFGSADLATALTEFRSRDRRFGRIPGSVSVCLL